MWVIHSDCDAFYASAEQLYNTSLRNKAIAVGVNTLPQLVSKKNKMIYLIDTTIGKKQLLKNDNITFYSKSWCESVCGEYQIYTSDGIVVMKYHHFGRLIEQYNGFAEQFELILCDEIHNSVYFGNIHNEEEDNYARIAKEEIENLIQRNQQVIVIGITATPSILIKFNCRINWIPLDRKNLYRYETKYKLPFQNIYNLIGQLDKDKIGIIYTTHVEQMKKIVEIAKNQGINAIAIWSINNKKNAMDDEQCALWRYIVKEEALPPEYDLIVINASCGTAIIIRRMI